jgi:AAHS family 4-hydroxybenzoate transporter-like MFS transporter
MSALIDAGSWTVYQKFLTALAALAVIFDGFDIQILAFAIPSLIQDWHVKRADFGPVLALGLAGMVIGGPVAGYIGDRFGRRPALIGTVALFGLATVATAFVNGLAGLTVLRFLTGLGAGGAMPNAGTLAAEFAPMRRRSAAVKFTIVCIPLGGMLGGLIAAQVLPAMGWRALYAIGGAAPLAFAAVLWALLPESPRFLVRHAARWGDLTRLLNRMGYMTEAGARFEDAAEKKGAERISVATLFHPELARDTVGLWTAFFFCLGSVYLVFGWLPTMLSAQGLGLAAASSGLAIYNFGGVLGVLSLTAVLTIAGSRRPMLLFSLASAASAVALTCVPVGPDTTVLMAAIGLNGFLTNAVQTSMYALAAHVYPTAVRSSGVAYAAATGRVGALITSLYGAAIIQAGAPVFWWALAICMVMTFGGLAWVRNHFAPVPQTKNA